MSKWKLLNRKQKTIIRNNLTNEKSIRLLQTFCFVFDTYAPNFTNLENQTAWEMLSPKKDKGRKRNSIEVIYLRGNANNSSKQTSAAPSVSSLRTTVTSSVNVPSPSHSHACLCLSHSPLHFLFPSCLLLCITFCLLAKPKW